MLSIYNALYYAMILFPRLLYAFRLSFIYCPTRMAPTCPLYRLHTLNPVISAFLCTDLVWVDSINAISTKMVLVTAYYAPNAYNSLLVSLTIPKRRTRSLHQPPSSMEIRQMHCCPGTCCAHTKRNRWHIAYDRYIKIGESHIMQSIMKWR